MIFADFYMILMHLLEWFSKRLLMVFCWFCELLSGDLSFSDHLLEAVTPSSSQERGADRGAKAYTYDKMGQTFGELVLLTRKSPPLPPLAPPSSS